MGKVLVTTAAAAGRLPARARWFPPSMWQALVVASVWRVLLGIVGVLAPSYLSACRCGIPPPFGWQPRGLSQVIASGVHNDAVWYADIAQHGYSYSTHHMSSMGFYPLYPMAIRALMLLVGNVYVAGLLVSTACLFIAVALFSIWLEDQGLGRYARTATALMLLFPYAFFFGTMYAESLYLCLALGAFVCYHRRLWGGAAAFTALAVLARPTGLVVVACLALGLRERDNRLGRCVPVLAGLASAAGFVIYQWSAFGSPLAYVHAKAVPGWGVRPARLLAEFTLSHGSGYPRPYLVIMMICGLLALATVPLVLRSLGLMAAAFVVLSVLAALTAGLPGLDRYVIVCFPSFAALAMLGRPRLLVVLGTIGACLEIGLMMLFARGYGIY